MSLLQIKEEVISQKKILEDANKIKIRILSNITINPMPVMLEHSILGIGYYPTVEIGNYDNIIQDSANIDNEDLDIIFYDIFGVMNSIVGYFESFEETFVDRYISKIQSDFLIIANNLSGKKYVIFNLLSLSPMKYSIQQTMKIEKLVNKTNEFFINNKPDNFILVDINKILIEIGIKSAVSFKHNMLSKAPYTIEFYENYLKLIQPVFLRLTGKLKKAVIFDCDNTLWKGILGEDGADGIDMSPETGVGKIFLEIQSFAKYLSEKGILIGLCSKNNLKDVNDLLDNHQHVILKNDHIVIKKINWNDKVQNIREIAKELNIGLDSIVFVDDSDFEINSVKELLPDVSTFLVPKDINLYPIALKEEVYSSFNFDISSEDLNRTRLYHEISKRAEIQKTFDDMEKYIASLGIIITVSKNESSHTARIAQMTQKTNQFNFTTKRYSEQEITGFINDKKVLVYDFSVLDNFGDSGITGLCIVKRINENEAIIDTFLMSCRILGRNIEHAFLDYLIGDLIQHRLSKLYSTYIKSKKNQQTEEFFEGAGFIIEEKTEYEKQYSINLEKYSVKNIRYINVKINKPKE